MTKKVGTGKITYTIPAQTTTEPRPRVLGGSSTIVVYNTDVSRNKFDCDLHPSLSSTFAQWIVAIELGNTVNVI